MRYARYGGDYRVERPGRLIRRAARLARNLLWPAIGALLTAILATAARLVGPFVVRDGVDGGIGAGDTGAIATAAMVFIGLLVFQYVAQRIAQYAVAWVGERFLLRIRTAVFDHLMRLDMPFYDRSKTGVLVSRMTSDIESMTEFANEGAMLALTNVLTAVGVAVGMLILDPRLALISFAVIGGLALMTIVFQRQIARAYQRVREQIGRVLAGLQEGITGVRVVQAFTQEQAQALNFGRINERYFEANMSAARAISWYFPGVSFLRIVAVALVLLFGGLRVIDGGLTPGTLIAFLLYLDWFFQPIINLANVYNLLQASLAALGKIYELLDTKPTVQELPGSHDLPAAVRGELTLESVTFGYEPSRPVLHSVELTVVPGQRVAIVGETGAGKSTVAKLLMRFYDPTSGSVLVDGNDLRRLADRSRSSAISLIPQDDFLFNGTLRDNLRYGRREASDRDIYDVLRAMGIQEWFQSLPEGLDTPVRERGSRFSAGERQLIALGRAFLVDPSVIVLDEATSNLDPETEVHVEGALRVLLAGRTSVVIAHRLRSAQRADRVVVIDAGSIVADGTHAELLRTSPQYARLVEVWERGNV